MSDDSKQTESRSLHLRVPAVLYTKIRELATQHQRSFNNIAKRLLEYAVEEAEKDKEEADVRS